MPIPRPHSAGVPHPGRAVLVLTLAALFATACGDEPATGPGVVDIEQETAARLPEVSLTCSPGMFRLQAASTATITCRVETAVDRPKGLRIDITAEGSVPGLELRPLVPLPATLEASMPVHLAFAVDAVASAPQGLHTITIRTGRGQHAGEVVLPVEVTPAGPVIRLAYLVPSDMSPEAAVMDSLDRSIRRIQSWYQERTGETFAIGLPVVETFALENPATYYTATPNHTDPQYYYFWNTVDEGMELTGATFYSTTAIWLLVNAASAGTQIGSAAVPGMAISDGLVVDGLMGRNPLLTRCGAIGAQAHELGHTFGLPHSDSPSLMSSAFLAYPDATLWPDERTTVLASPFIQTLANPEQLSCAGGDLLAGREMLKDHRDQQMGWGARLHPDLVPGVR